MSLLFKGIAEEGSFLNVEGEYRCFKSRKDFVYVVNVTLNGI